MADILVVAEHAGHDGPGEEVDGRCCEDMLDPVALILVLRPGCLYVLFSHKHQDRNRVVMHAKANGVWSRTHFNGIAHVVLKPVIHTALNFSFTVGVLLATSPTQWWQWTFSIRLVDDRY